MNECSFQLLTKVIVCIVFPGSQPCLRRPQQPRDKRHLPARWQLPGVDRREGHECDAVEDSLRQKQILSVLTDVGRPETQLNWTELNCTKLNRTKLKLTQMLNTKSGSAWTEVNWQKRNPRFLFLICSQILNEVNCGRCNVLLLEIQKILNIPPFSLITLHVKKQNEHFSLTYCSLLTNETKRIKRIKSN